MTAPGRIAARDLSRAVVQIDRLSGFALQGLQAAAHRLKLALQKLDIAQVVSRHCSKAGRRPCQTSGAGSKRLHHSARVLRDWSAADLAGWIASNASNSRCLRAWNSCSRHWVRVSVCWGARARACSKA